MFKGFRKRKNIQNNDLPGIKNIGQPAVTGKLSLAPYPAMKLLVPAISGIIGGVNLPVGLEWWIGGCTLAGLAFIAGLAYEQVKRKGAYPRMFTVFSAILFIGFAFASSACFRYFYAPSPGLVSFTGKTVILSGRVAVRPEKSGKGIGMVLDVEEVFDRGRKIRLQDRANVFIRNLSDASPGFQYGDMVRVKGSLLAVPAAANRGEYSPRAAARMKGIRVQLFAAGPWLCQKTGPSRLGPLDRFIVLPVCGYITESLGKLMPDGVERQLAAGVLTGEKEFLPEEVFKEFKITGTAHILAVSGFNVGLLALIVHIALQRLKTTAAGRWVALLLVLFILLVYSRVTGNSPSVNRAAIMAAVFAAGQAAGRKTFPLNSLALSDVFILLAEPLDLLNPGFLMTNSAVVSILIFNSLSGSGMVKEGGAVRKSLRFLEESFLVTLAAVVGVSPVIAFYFGSFSLVSLAANIPVVLFSTLLMYALVPMLLVNLVSSYAASFFAESAIFFARLTLDSAGFFSSFPFASLALKPDLLAVVMYYVTLGSVLYFYSCKAWGTLAVSLLIGLNLIFWTSFFRPRPEPPSIVTVNLGRNIVTFCNNGNETVQVDAGSATRDEKRVLRQLDEYGLPAPAAAVQFFSADSLVSAVPAKRHMLQGDSILVLPSMVIARPGEKILRIMSKNRSLVFVSGTSRLKEEPSCTADIAFLWIYRFGEKQQEQLQSWLAYARPKRCFLIPGSFLSRSHHYVLQHFASRFPSLEIRSKTRQIVVPF